MSPEILHEHPSTMSTDHDDRPATAIEDLSYADALLELEDLLDELESSDVDVDRLTRQVARGVQLVRFCRSRLEIVTGEVDGVVAELVSADPDDHDPARQDGDESE